MLNKELFQSQELRTFSRVPHDASQRKRIAKETEAKLGKKR